MVTDRRASIVCVRSPFTWLAELLYAGSAVLPLSITALTANSTAKTKSPTTTAPYGPPSTCSGPDRAGAPKGGSAHGGRFGGNGRVEVLLEDAGQFLGLVDDLLVTARHRDHPPSRYFRRALMAWMTTRRSSSVLR